ncbi:MAG: RNA polymerase factor sigma-32 [Alphaproteobacteria bacterium]
MGYIDNQAAREASASFVRSAMSTPLLTREREQELAMRWRDADDEAALHELVRSYARLVAGMAARFRNYGLPAGDLLQEGNVGLLQAAARFEPERGVRFSTYATWWVRSAMQDYILRNWSIVRTGTTSAQKALFFNLRRLRARIEGETGGALDSAGRERIASELQVPLRDVESMEMRIAAIDQSLNAPIGEDGDDNWQDLLPDQRPSPEAVVTRLHDAARRRKWLRDALGELPAREQRIVRCRLLSDEPTTLEALGRELGVSKERVRQLERRALNRLRASLDESFAVPADLLAED